jgi:hypothetical protein
MSTLSMASIASLLVLTAFAAAPLTGCGGGAATSTGTTGSGGSGGSASTTTTSASTGTGGAAGHGCGGYCKSILACATAATCVFADPAGAQSACAASCDDAVGALSAAEQGLVDTCLACANQATGGACFLTLPMGSCKTECDGADTDAAMKKWLDVVGNAPLDPAAACTNGVNALANQDCAAGGGGSTCSVQCCNQTCGATPDVAADCTTPTSGPATCTCTEGKNKGKTFTPAGQACSSVDVWNACNL